MPVNDAGGGATGQTGPRCFSWAGSPSVRLTANTADKTAVHLVFICSLYLPVWISWEDERQGRTDGTLSAKERCRSRAGPVTPSIPGPLDDAFRCERSDVSTAPPRTRCRLRDEAPSRQAGGGGARLPFRPRAALPLPDDTGGRCFGMECFGRRSALRQLPAYTPPPQDVREVSHPIRPTARSDPATPRPVVRPAPRSKPPAGACRRTFWKSAAQTQGTRRGPRLRRLGCPQAGPLRRTAPLNGQLDRPRSSGRRRTPAGCQGEVRRRRAGPGNQRYSERSPCLLCAEKLPLSAEIPRSRRHLRGVRHPLMPS